MCVIDRPCLLAGYPHPLWYSHIGQVISLSDIFISPLEDLYVMRRALFCFSSR